MGGSSKPADPKVTPFVEPAAPSKPIPNFFGGQGGTGYTPDFNASKAAFGQQPVQQPAQPVSQPMQAQSYSQPAAQGDWTNVANGGLPQMQQAMQYGRGFAIPTPPSPNMGGGMHDRLMQAMQGPFYRGGQGFDVNALMQRFQSNPNFLMDMFSGIGRGAPRNYTDTDPAQSTDENGMTLGNPFRRS